MSVFSASGLTRIALGPVLQHCFVKFGWLLVSMDRRGGAIFTGKYNCIRSEGPALNKQRLLLSRIFLGLPLLGFYSHHVFLPNGYHKFLTKLSRIERSASERIQWMYRKVIAR